MGQFITSMIEYIATTGTFFMWPSGFNYDINDTNRIILIYKYIFINIQSYRFIR